MTDFPTSAPLSPGTVLGGDFRIVRPLSQGGMGAVFVAEQISTGKPRAVKLMHAQIAQSPHFRERFEQEARVGARIESEHVVEVVASGVDPATQTPWLAMELLEGSDLAAVVAQRGALPRDEVREMMGQLCHALGAAHRAGVVHRDLKPENVFIARSRQQNVRFKVKVLDFGVAKIVADARATMSLTASVGTPLWMAPEQTEASTRVTPASDVWSLGLLAFYLLTARLYWLEPGRGRNASVMSLMREVLFGPLEPPSTRAAHHGCAHLLPAGFDAWFTRCVVRDPRARFPDAAQAMAALDPVLAAASLRPAAPPSAHPVAAPSAHPLPAPHGQPSGAVYPALSRTEVGGTVVGGGMDGSAMSGGAMGGSAMSGGAMGGSAMSGGAMGGAMGGGAMGGSAMSGGATGATLALVPASPRRKTPWGLLMAVIAGGLVAVAALVLGGVVLLARLSATEPAPVLPPQGGAGPALDGASRPAASSAPARSDLELAGTYDITSSRNPGGQGSYAGNVLLSRTGDTYRIAWIITKGSGYEGIAFVQDRTLAVGWASGGLYGAAAYRIDGGRLRGHWISTDRPGRVEAEALEGPEGLAGSYRIVEGDRQGTVVIAPAGETYAVTWALSTGALKGVGIRSGDQLVVGWSPGQQVGVVAYGIDGRQLAGRWASLGSALSGSETLLRR